MKSSEAVVVLEMLLSGQQGVAVQNIDLDNPPMEPPAQCVDPFLWRLARQMFEEHRRTRVGECVTCPRWKPCSGAALAKDGLATALGQRVKESPYWIAYAQLVALARARGSSSS